MRSGLNKEELRKLRRKREAARQVLLAEIAEREQRKKEARGKRSGLSKAELRKQAKGKALEKSIDITENTFIALARETPTQGHLVANIIKHVSGNTKNIILTEIRKGLQQGKSVSQIIKAITGTKAAGRKDGALSTVINSIKRDVNTLVNHVTNTVHIATYKALGKKKVKFVAVLDSRTSKQCQGLNGKVYDINKPFPRPPLHYNCRSKVIPI